MGENNIRRRILILTLGFLLALANLDLLKPGSLHAISEVDELLELLVRKEVITQEEAATFRAELAIKKQEEQEKPRKEWPVIGKTSIKASGYGQMRYNVDEGGRTNDEFRVRRARLIVQGDLTERLGYRFQLDPATGSRPVISSVDFKKATTRSTNVARPILLDAQLDYKFSPKAVLSVGQFKVPFSLENLTSGNRLDTINRSQVVERLVPGRDIGSQGRDIGAKIGGEFYLDSGNTSRKIAEYAFGIFNGAGINTLEENNFKDLVGRALVYPMSELALGVSYYNGEAGTKGSDKTRTGLELAFLKGPISLKGEYIFGEDGSIDKRGWYAQAGYRILPSLELIAKFDTFDPDRDSRRDATDVTTLGFNWFFTKWGKLQLNYELKDEERKEQADNSFLTLFQAEV